MALDKLRHTKELKQKANKELYYALNAHLNVSTQLLYLKKVYEKIQSKKYHLVK